MWALQNIHKYAKTDLGDLLTMNASFLPPSVFLRCKVCRRAKPQYLTLAIAYSDRASPAIAHQSSSLSDFRNQSVHVTVTEEYVQD